MVETKTLNISVSAAPPPGEPNMRFSAYNPPWELREIIAKQTEYAPGETVYVKYRVKNIGEGAGIATIVVKDADTGAVLQTWTTPLLAPTNMYKIADVGVRIGSMPNRDWNLSFKVTP